MRTMTPGRRRAAILAFCAVLAATSPVLLAGAGHGRGHDFFFGIGTGIAFVLLAASITKLRRSSC